MSLMKKFPIDTIKIDRSFVQDIASQGEDQAIAQAIISLGKALGLTVVAEGVETLDQEAFLKSHNYDQVQGFLYSKAVDSDQIPELLGVQYVQAESQPLAPEEIGITNVNDQAAHAARRLRRTNRGLSSNTFQGS